MKKPKPNPWKIAVKALMVIATCALCGLFLWQVVKGSLSYQGNFRTNHDPQAKPRGCETFYGGSGVCDCKGNCYCHTGRSEKCPGCPE